MSMKSWEYYIGPKWQGRLVKLRLEGKTYKECLEILKKEGFKSSRGYELQVTHLMNRIQQLKSGYVKNNLLKKNFYDLE